MPITLETPETTVEMSAPQAQEDAIYVASQWRLMWWKFRKHKMAVIGGIFVILLYLAALLAEFVAPYDPFVFNAKFTYAPPQRIHLFDAQGKLHWPFTYEIVKARDPNTFQVTYKEQTDGPRHALRLLARSTPYKMWGLLASDRHLFGIENENGKGTFFLWGTDRQGRDLFSRIVHGTRVSLSVSLIGTFLSVVFGVLFGGISGFFGGWIDMLIQRLIDFLNSIPTLPLWMGLAAAIPLRWDPLTVYYLITIILSLLSWTGMARVVRGRFLAMREEEFVLAAKLLGASDLRVILRHMAPSFLSHIIAVASLTIPALILSETSLSFIGLGLRPPVVSWGVLLQDAQNVQAIALSPWLLIPAVVLIVTVVAFNFFGDGLRDAADPYSR